MLLEIQKQLGASMGRKVEIITKNSQRIVGIVTWLSPDHAMAELKLADGQSKLLTDVTIMQVKHL